MDQNLEKLLANKSKIEVEIKELNDKIKENGVVKGIKQILNPDFKFEKEELNILFQNIMNLLSDRLSEKEQQDIEFYGALLENGLKLDEKQLKHLRKIMTMVQQPTLEDKNNMELLKQKLEDINIIISAYESSPTLETYKILPRFFEENKMSFPDQYKLIMAALKNSINAPRGTYTLDNDVISDGKLLSYDDCIKMLMSKYRELVDIKDVEGISVDGLNNLLAVLDKLENNKIGQDSEYVRMLFYANNMLEKIAYYSKPEYIDKVADICNRYNIQLGILLSKLVNVIIHNPNDQYKRIGQYAMFVSNVEFFEKNDRKIIERQLKSNVLFATNVFSQDNYKVMTEEYGFSSAYAVSQNAVQRIDAFIESSINGYRYLKDNDSYFAKKYDKRIALMSKYLEQKNDGRKIFVVTKENNVRLSQKKVMEEPMFVGGNYYVPGAQSEELLGGLLGFIPNELLINSLCPNFRKYCDDFQIAKHPNNYRDMEEELIIKKLDELYTCDNYAYVIDGLRISRPKVIRMCAMLMEKGETLTPEALRFVMIYNSCLTEKDKERVVNASEMVFQKIRGMKR